jgi:hypothetical protein
MTKNIYVHGRVYKANNTLKSQDTTFLTTEDCKNIVNVFRSSGGYLPVNYQHDLQTQNSVTSILGQIEDLYFDGDNLNCIFAIDPAFPSSNSAIADMKTKKLAGLSIELKCTLDEKTKLVTEKKMIGLGVVYFPDHEKDGTLITGFTENGKNDLPNKDEILMTYLKSPNADKVITDKYQPKKNETPDSSTTNDNNNSKKGNVDPSNELKSDSTNSTTSTTKDNLSDTVQNDKLKITESTSSTSVTENQIKNNNNGTSDLMDIDKPIDKNQSTKVGTYNTTLHYK